MADFLAAPFMMLMFACAHVAGFISNRVIIIAVESDEEDDDATEF